MRTILVGLASAAIAGCAGGGAEPVSLEQARKCLAATQGLEVMPPAGRGPEDTDAPDQTIWATSTDVTVALGYYDDPARAESAAAEQVEHSKQYQGRVDRHGRLTVIWVRGQDSEEASAIEDCVLS